MAKVFNWFILALILLGAVLSFREGNRNRMLLAEHKRLVKEYGYLPIEDPQKVHVVALPSADPLHFRWRIYLPANYKSRWKTRNSTSSSSSSAVRNFIAQVRFRFDEKGELRVFHYEDMGSGLSGLGSRAFDAYLKENWDKLQIKQAGLKGVESYERDQVIELLELRVSDDLAAELKEKFRGRMDPNGVPVIYNRRLGTQAAFDADAKRKRDGYGR